MAKNKKQHNVNNLKNNENLSQNANEQYVNVQPPKYFFGTKASGLAYLVSFILSIIFGLILSGMYKSSSFVTKVSAYIILQLMFVAVIAIVSVYSKVNPIKEFNFKKTAHYSSYIIFSVAIIAVLFCFTNFANLFEFGLQKLGYKITLSDSTLVGSNIGELIYAIFAVALLPAIFEELVFRGIILKGTMQYGKFYAIVISTICFTLFHGSIEQTIYQAVLGVMFGLAYITTGDIKVSMLMHFLNNATVLIYSYCVNAETITKLSGGKIALAIGLALLGILIIWLATFLIKKIKKEKTPLLVEKEQKHYNVLLIVAIFLVSINWIFNTIYGFGIDLNNIFKGA